MHDSQDPNPSSSTFKLGDLGQEAAPLCACFLRGCDSGKGTGSPLGPESHPRPFSCPGTYCAPAPVPKGPMRLFTAPVDEELFELHF